MPICACFCAPAKNARNTLAHLQHVAIAVRGLMAMICVNDLGGRDDAMFPFIGTMAMLQSSFCLSLSLSLDAAVYMCPHSLN